MKKISRKLRVSLLITIIMCIVCIMFMTFSLFTSYDASANYFKSSFIYYFSLALIIIAAAACSVSALILPKGELSGDSPTTLPVSIVSVVPAISYAVAAILIFTGKVKIGNVAPNLLTYLCAAFCALSAVYFVLNCIFADSKNSVKVFFGYAVALSQVLLMAVSYFDMTVSMNAPLKSFLYFAFVAFALWMLLECRTVTKKQYPRLYFALGLITCVLSGSASFPWLMALASNKIGSPLYPSYIIYNVIAIAILAYTLTRMIVFVSARSLVEKLSGQTYSDDEQIQSDEEEE